MAFCIGVFGSAALRGESRSLSNPCAYSLFLIDIIMSISFVVVGSVVAANKMPGLARTVGYGFLGGAAVILVSYPLTFGVALACFS